jgi:hypothetical protein
MNFSAQGSGVFRSFAEADCWVDEHSRKLFVTVRTGRFCPKHKNIEIGPRERMCARCRHRNRLDSINASRRGKRNKASVANR